MTLYSGGGKKARKAGITCSATGSYKSEMPSKRKRGVLNSCLLEGTEGGGRRYFSAEQATYFRVPGSLMPKCDPVLESADSGRI